MGHGASAEDLLGRYRALCEHYGMEPTRNNRGGAHKNSSIEGPHGHLKRNVADALALSGSSDFADFDVYRGFVAEVVGRANRHRTKVIEVERATLRDLPVDRTLDYEPIGVNIGQSSGFTWRHVFYTVPSRLIGHRLGSCAGLTASPETLSWPAIPHGKSVFLKLATCDSPSVLPMLRS